MGETGKGQAAKLAMNLQIALIYEGFAEAPHPRREARRGRRSPDPADPGLHGEVGRGRIQSAVCPETRLFRRTSRCASCTKTSNSHSTPPRKFASKLPALETVEEIYDVAIEDGHGDLDYAATLHAARKMGGSGSERHVGLTLGRFLRCLSEVRVPSGYFRNGILPAYYRSITHRADGPC